MIKSLIAAASLMFLSTSALAVQAKTYQVTGPIVEITDDTVTVLKGKEKWTVGLDPSTKVDGHMKVGSKVTLEYRMMAATIAVKDAGPAPKKKK